MMSGNLRFDPTRAVADSELRASRILIIDDESANIALLVRVLRRAGFANLQWTEDPREVAELVRESEPDLILLDLRMPHMDGFEVLEQLRPEIGKTTYLPILVVSADITADAKTRALSQGAKDFLHKPFDLVEVMLRIRNLLETRHLYLELQRQNLVLEARVKERTQELEEAQIEVIDRLARAAEYRDHTTGQHTGRVGELSALLASTLRLPQEEVELIRKAAPLHDVGKICLSDAILLKPGRLSPAESELNRPHTTLGAELLAGGHFPLMRMAEEIALTHHERWDGAGYPRGLAGEDIPLSGRIVAVADVFDALVHERPYKRAWTVEEAVTEIAEQSGKQFDPEIVQAMLSLMDPANVDGHARLREIYPAKIYSEQLNAHALSITD
jgi:putative two-component system response regulator